MKKRLYREEREFGLIVGGAFTLLSAWWVYRERFPFVALLTLTLGLLLVLLGLLFPRVLFYPNKIWMTLAAVLGYISTRIILGIVFFLLITPIGFVKRLFGWDPLQRRAEPRDTDWRPYSTRQRDRRHFEKMY